MRNLLITYMCNKDGHLIFGNLVSTFEEYPNIIDLNGMILKENEGVTEITIMNLVELNDEDFNRFTK